MKIQSSKVNFQGNRLKYQKFDHIVRNVNNQYPRISPYRVNMRFGNKFLPERLANWIIRSGEIVDENRRKISGRNYVDIIKNDINGVKQSHLGDCGESSALTIASLIANGFKDFKIGLLLFDVEIRKKGQKEVISRRFYNTTHECVVLDSATSELSSDSIRKNKEAVVLDSWIGFCGNVQQAFGKFQEVFMNGIRKTTDSNGYEYSYKPYVELLDLKINVDDNLTKDFAKEYSGLVLKSSK